MVRPLGGGVPGTRAWARGSTARGSASLAVRALIGVHGGDRGQRLAVPCGPCRERVDTATRSPLAGTVAGQGGRKSVTYHQSHHRRRTPYGSHRPAPPTPPRGSTSTRGGDAGHHVHRGPDRDGAGQAPARPRRSRVAG
ncbi:hypothetical protein QJS66_17665 [Kocuria rhizophila]|nr:hypothetical protein QJS66_17665 [Kocuria rhizophila]